MLIMSANVHSLRYKFEVDFDIDLGGEDPEA